MINEDYHDKLFPYSTLQGIEYRNKVLTDIAGNGVTKMYISAAYSGGYDLNEPLLVYRKSLAQSGRGFKSAITSLATVAQKYIVKAGGSQKIQTNEALKILGNKSILTPQEITEMIAAHKNIIIYRLVYNYYFGTGHNVNWVYLKKHGFWKDGYPTEFTYTNEEIKTLIKETNHDIITIMNDFLR